MAYERGEWEQAASLAASCGLKPSALPDAYTGALRWAQDVSSTV
jgi:hypothetical protein